MTPDADTDRRRLQHMLDAIDSIHHHAPERTAFDGSELVRSHVVLKLQVVGEAANALRAQTRATHDDVPWSQVIGMRHRIVHDYAAINLDIVWDIVQHELSSLRAQLEIILREVELELDADRHG